MWILSANITTLYSHQEIFEGALTFVGCITSLFIYFWTTALNKICFLGDGLPPYFIFLSQVWTRLSTFKTTTAMPFIKLLTGLSTGSLALRMIFHHAAPWNRCLLKMGRHLFSAAIFNRTISSFDPSSSKLNSLVTFFSVPILKRTASLSELSLTLIALMLACQISLNHFFFPWIVIFSLVCISSHHSANECNAVTVTDSQPSFCLSSTVYTFDGKASVYTQSSSCFQRLNKLWLQSNDYFLWTYHIFWYGLGTPHLKRHFVPSLELFQNV